MKLIIALIGASLTAQVVPLASGDTVSGSGGYPRINANIAYLDSKHLIGTGSPVGAVPCSISQNLGFFYMRIDAGAAFASFYVCTKTSASGYSWEGPYGAGGGGSGNMLGSNNLSEITSAANARTNLGLGSIATFASSAFEPFIAAGTTAQYRRGDKTWQLLTTSAVAEVGNLYFTTARVHSVLGGVTVGGIPLANGTSYNLAVLPSCNGTSDKLLSTTSGFTCGVDLNSGGGGGGTPGGTNGQVQFNNAGAFGGIDTIGSGSLLRAQSPVMSDANLAGVSTTPTAAPGTNTTQIANTAFVAALGALKANTADPTFTGSPRVPTATPGTNSTIIASTAYADAIAALKANILDPTFTGDPKAPTAALGDNDTSVASTAHVQAAIADKILGLGSGNARKVVVQNAAGTDTAWSPINRMAPIVASNSGLDLVTGGCAYRDTVDGGYFESIALVSTDGQSTLVSGSITFTFTAASNGTDFTIPLGTVSLASASNAVDSTLTGWTRDVAAGANSRVRVCLTSVGSGMKNVTVSPRFR